LLSAQHAEPNLSAELHLLEGGKRGILQLKMEVMKGWYTFGMDEPRGGIGVPSKVRLDDRKRKITAPPGLKLLGSWTPGQPSKSVKLGYDEERHLVHEGVIVWKSDIAIAEGADATNWNFTIYYSGQICSDQVCRPIYQKVPVTIVVAPKNQNPESSSQMRNLRSKNSIRGCVGYRDHFPLLQQSSCNGIP
jgi:hypothetical protein